MKKRAKNPDATKTRAQKPKNIYLFGNGINNGIESETNKAEENSWADILKHINKTYAGGKINNIENKPFPLAYDEIINYNFLFKSNDEVEIKQKLQKDLNKIPLNYRYDDLKNLKYDEILTTNYDYNFERAIDENWKRKTNHGYREIKYSCFRRQSVKDKFVWHIHGEQQSYSSILLGFRHYIDYAARIKTETQNQLFNVIRTNKNDVKDQSWLTYFFTDNIRIIGLSMANTEYPLYWLLAYRFYLKESHPDYIVDNKIEYLIPTFSINEDRKILEALSSYGVDIITYDVPPGDYDGFYKKVLNNENGKKIKVYKDKTLFS